MNALLDGEGYGAAYIGVVKCSDYVSLIQKHNGDLNKGLFFENVRDYLGSDNTVNEEIAKTIHTEEERDRFAILNNGVTIVAKSVTPSGDLFRIGQFQVVNGCQTSHVLFHNRSALSADMYITVKLIETSDVDLSGKVIATTNSQSQVTKEAFATIRPYHRKLEDFFSAMRSSDYVYYYERRPHQYDDRDDVRQNDIVSAPSLIKSFISVVLEEPHKVHYYYGRLLEEYNKDQSSELFSDTDHPGIYFAAHHIAVKVKSRASRSRAYRDWIYHIALLVKKTLAPDLKKNHGLSDGKFLELIGQIDSGFDSAYDAACAIVDAAKLDRHSNRLPDVTDSLVSMLARRSTRSDGAPPPRANRSGEFSYNDGRYVGEILAVTQNIANLKYGPYKVEANVPAGASPMEGQRWAFEVSGGRAVLVVAP